MSFTRLAGAAGLAGVALLVATFFFAPSPPQLGDPATEIVEYYADEHDGVVSNGYLTALAAFAFGIFAAGVWTMLRNDADGWAVLGLISAAALGAMALLLAAGSIAIAVQAERGPDEDVMSAMFHLLNAASAMIGVVAGSLLLGFSIAGKRLGVLPGWLVWLAYLAVAGALLGVSGAYATDNDFAVAVGHVTFVAFLLWAAVVGVRMWTRTEERARPAGPPAT
jgi:hypothetical protein